MSGHLRCTHIEILPIDWCRKCWQHKGGHQMCEVIEAAKAIVKTEGNLSIELRKELIDKTSHDETSFDGFITNTLSIYNDGFHFTGPACTGGKGTLLPRICKELEWGQDGRHRVAIAYVLGVETIPVVIHNTDRDFDDGSSVLSHAAKLIEEFFESILWKEYQETNSYKILASTKLQRLNLGLNKFSRVDFPSLEWEPCLSVDEFHDKLLSHPKLGDLKIVGRNA